VPSVAGFLRGVNLGPTRRLPMADLRSALSDAGFEDVRTVLQSGNVVVRSRKAPATVAREMEAVIEERFGLRSDVLARSAKELEAVVAANPFDGVATSGSKQFVMFLPKEPKAATLRELEAEDWGIDRFVADGREIHVWCPEGMRDSRLIKEMHRPKRLGETFTVRNWNTVTKVLELALTP
jgi:uncharacterized protein (DUF1697 family)